MSVAEDRAEVVRQWLVRAEADLEAARRLSRAPEAALLAIVCFHAQQSMEKHIKAWLIHLGLEPPRTHSIVALCSLCPETPPLSPLEQIEMTDYAVTSRYPGEVDPLTAEHAQVALSAAARVCAFVRDRIRGIEAATAAE
jgi:HEPN domain-containing protein